MYSRRSVARQLFDDLLEMVTEQFHYRELLLQMTKRDLALRYKQAIMGFGWAVFMPVLNTALFSVIFTRVAPLDTGVPYPLYAYCGLCSWSFFASSLRFATISLASNTNLVTKVYFPREILPLSSILVCAVDFAVSLILLGALMAYYGIAPGPSLLAVPLLLTIQVLFTFAVGLLLAMANLFYRDVKYLIEALLMIWMFATSVVYPVQLVGGRLGSVLALNPMTPLIDGFRSAVLLNQWPSPSLVLAVGVGSVAFLLFAWLVFHRGEFRFAENI